LLKDATSTERSIILQWINEVLTTDNPGHKLSVKEVHGLVWLLGGVYKGWLSVSRIAESAGIFSGGVSLMDQIMASLWYTP
jgi:hypothetical protein